MEVYQPIYLANQWIVLDEPVVFKHQRTKQGDIEVWVYIMTGKEITSKVIISKIVLFNDLSNKQRETDRIENISRL